MNIFDGFVIASLIVVTILGFRAGLLRSAATILGYLMAMPVAAFATSLIIQYIIGYSAAATSQNSVIFFVVFLVTGIGMGSMLRMAVDETVGSEIGLADRCAGGLLGAIRVVLIAVTLVLIFDRLEPANAQPFYLVGSQLRPTLSALGQRGFKTLPPDVTAYIDQLKRDRHI